MFVAKRFFTSVVTLSLTQHRLYDLMAAITSESFRWGVAGVGKISADFAVSLTRTPGAVVSAVAASSDLARAEAFAANIAGRQSGAPVAAFASYAELAASPLVDVVYIGNINTLHFATSM